jgi:hypothetical protein
MCMSACIVTLMNKRGPIDGRVSGEVPCTMLHTCSEIAVRSEQQPLLGCAVLKKLGIGTGSALGK